MKIYTKTGDKGQTGLFQGPRVPKNNPRIEAYGTIDELNAVIGMTRTCDLPPTVDRSLGDLQETLFVLGSDLATPLDVKDTLRIQPHHVQRLEEDMDHWDQVLFPLKNFVLPGGDPAAAWLHLARTICRRAERACTPLVQEGEIAPHCYEFINRLSDWLFVLSRKVNREKGVEDVKWSAS